MRKPVPWTSQPQYPVRFAANYGPDAMALIGGYIGVNTPVGVDGTAVIGITTPTGIGITPYIGTFGAVKLRPPRMLQASGGVMSWVVFFIYKDNGSVCALFGSGNNNGAYVEQFNTASDENGNYSPGKFRFVLRGADGSNLIAGSTNAVFSDGRAYAVSIKYVSNSKVDVYINGHSVQLNYASNSFTNGSSGIMTPEPYYAVGNFRYGGLIYNGNIDNKIALFARIPAVIDDRGVSKNPWQIFAPLKRRRGSVGNPPQLLAPTGPATSTGWLSSTGGDLYTCVDEATADGADYVYTTTPGSVVEWTFPSGGAVSANGGFVRYQIPAGTGSVSVELRQGASLVQTLGTHTLTGSVQNIAVAITASTTDSVDLRVRFTGNA